MKWIVLPFVALTFSSAFAITDNANEINLGKPTSPVLNGVEDPAGFVKIEYHPDKLNKDKPTSPMAIDDEAGFVKIDYTGLLEPDAELNPPDPVYEANRKKLLAKAIESLDPMRVLDLATAKEAATLYGQTESADQADAEQLANLKELADFGLGAHIDVDISTQRLSMTYDGQVVAENVKISSARKGYHTKMGSFKHPHLEVMHYSKKYDNSPMPHAEFYYKGYAVHGTYETKHLGHPASHGCVRVDPRMATLLYGYMNQAENDRQPAIITVHD